MFTGEGSIDEQDGSPIHSPVGYLVNAHTPIKQPPERFISRRPAFRCAPPQKCINMLKFGMMYGGYGPKAQSIVDLVFQDPFTLLSVGTSDSYVLHEPLFLQKSWYKNEFFLKFSLKIVGGGNYEKTEFSFKFHLKKPQFSIFNEFFIIFLFIFRLIFSDFFLIIFNIFSIIFFFFFKFFYSFFP